MTAPDDDPTLDATTYLATAVRLGLISESVAQEVWAGQQQTGTPARLLALRQAVGSEEDTIIRSALGDPDATVLLENSVEATATGSEPPAGPVRQQAASADSPRLHIAGPARFYGDSSRYEVVTQIGKGGMGLIWEAVDRYLRRHVAIKTLRFPWRDDVRTKFFEEARITGQLEHPGMVPVHDVGQDADGIPYLIMKQVRGRSLREILATIRQGEPTRFGLAQLLEVFKRVCESVAYAHNRGIIHRDLKPANVMVGEFGEVQLMDWGIAKRLGSSDTVRRRREGIEAGDAESTGTAYGIAKGTPAFMSPEQALGQLDRIGRRSDIYSLGALLYSILTLELPVDKGPTLDVLRQVAEGWIVPPSRRAGGRRVPPELEAIVLKAMSRDPDRRYASAMAIKGDVDAFLASRSPGRDHPTPPGLGERARPWLVTAALATLLAVAAAGLVYLGSAGRIGDSRSAAFDLRQRQAETIHAHWRNERRRVAAVALDPDDRQSYLTAHLEVLLLLTRAIRLHPSPPVEWRDRAAEDSDHLQTIAEDASLWATADYLAREATACGAVGDDVGRRRLDRLRLRRRTGETPRDD